MVGQIMTQINLAAFATFSRRRIYENKDTPSPKVLLRFYPLLEETLKDYETIDYMLKIHGKSWNKALEVVGDNVSTKNSLSEFPIYV